MTREQIEKMEAGPEMDRLVAELVLGWERGRPDHGEHYWKRPEETPVTPRYSTNIAAAWEVVKKMAPLLPFPTGPGFELSRGPGIIVGGKVSLHAARFFHANGPYYDVKSIGDTAPLAICRAALLSALPENTVRPVG